jgi:tetratricopeptide (TPR) repeat protein
MTDMLEDLPHNIQSTIDSRLGLGEELLVSLPGGMGEALAATSRRLFLAAEVREPGRPAREDVLDFLLTNVEKIDIEDTPTGGTVAVSIKGSAASAPRISFPEYKKEAFESAVGKIRELLASAAPSGGPGQPAPEAERCPGCGMVADPRFLYCPGCGIQLKSLCQNCNAAVGESWSFCAVCGRRLDRSRLAPSSPARAREMVDRETERAQVRKEPVKTAGEEDAEAINEKGTQCYEDGRIDEAIELFGRAIELAPDVSKYHINLGVAYGEADGKEDEALACYKRAAELDPRDPSPHLLMGYLFNEGGDPESARREWEQVAELAPGTAEAKEAQDAIANLDRL